MKVDKGAINIEMGKKNGYKNVNQRGAQGGCEK